MKKKYIMLIIIFVLPLLALAIVFAYFFVGSAPKRQNMTWGVDFSQMQAESLKLNWQDLYTAIIKDLGAKNIKLHTQWDWVEGKRGDYFFDDIDWQIAKAEENNVKIIYVTGMKTGRWPECHMPGWAKGLTKEEQQKEILAYIEKVILRYKNSPAIAYWQVENEPLFDFGICPWYDKEFLKKEVALVKSLDNSRQIIISDSGEQSNWWQAARTGDILGITMYREVWAHIADGMGFYFKSFLSPVTYWRKALLIEKLLGKKTICIELQAEPWAEKPFYDVPLSEQAKTMDVQQFKNNVEYARQTGLDTFYFWGVEWWYWMKEKQSRPEIWSEAQQLFNQSL